MRRLLPYRKAKAVFESMAEWPTCTKHGIRYDLHGQQLAQSGRPRGYYGCWRCTLKPRIHNAAIVGIAGGIGLMVVAGLIALAPLVIPFLTGAWDVFRDLPIAGKAGFASIVVVVLCSIVALVTTKVQDGGL